MNLKTEPKKENKSDNRRLSDTFDFWIYILKKTHKVITAQKKR